MNLRTRLNRLEKRASELKAENDDSAFVPAGVWWKNPETGEVIPGSGPTVRVPAEQEHAFGIMLTRPPCADKADFAEEIQRCEQYQRTLQNQPDE